MFFINTSWGFLEKFFKIINGLFLLFFVSKYLKPEGFGELSYLIAILSILYIINDFGLNDVVSKKIVESTISNTIVNNLFSFRLINSIILISISFLFFYSYLNQYKYIFIFFSLALIFNSFKVIEPYFQSYFQLKKTAISNILTVFFSIIFKIYLIYNNANLNYFIFSIFLDSLINSFLMYLMYFKYSKRHINFSINTSIYKNYLSKGYLLFFASIFSILIMRIDQLMIKNLMSSYDLGIYSVAATISESVNFVPVVLSYSLYPYLVNVKLDVIKYIANFIKFLKFTTIVAIVLIALFYLIGVNLINEFIDPVYSFSISISKILIFSILFISLGTCSNSFYMKNNLEKLIFKRSLICVGINIFLNFIFIPKYGIIAAAYSTLISNIFSGYLFDYLNKETRDLFYIKTRILTLQKTH
jgi:O-antigen/teichoic acid export membrane protein